MQPARPNEERRRAIAELVGLAGFGRHVADGVPNGIHQVDVALEKVVPGRRGGVLEVGHEDVGARVEGVDDHLAVDRPGDLDATVGEIGGQRRHGPRALAHLARLGKEGRTLAAIERLLPHLARSKKVGDAARKPAVQLGDEVERSLGEDPVVPGLWSCSGSGSRGVHGVRSGHEFQLDVRQPRSSIE